MTNAPPSSSKKDRIWGSIPLVTLAALIFIAMVDIWFLGWAAMLTDTCGSDRPCAVAGRINAVYLSALVIAVLGFIGTLVIRRQDLRVFRLISAAIAVLGALWPIVWLLLGNPHAS